MDCVERLATLAARLLREGYVDNEPDARLAAIRVIVAAEGLQRDERSEQEPNAARR